MKKSNVLKPLLAAITILLLTLQYALAKDDNAGAEAGKAAAKSSMAARDKPAAAENDSKITNPANQADNNEIRDAKLFFDESFGDFTEELEIAKEDGKDGLLIMFEMDECPFCKRMKQTVLNRASVQDFYRQHFRILSVDIEGDLEMTDFAGNTTTQKDFALKQYRVRATPVFQFFDLQGKSLKNGRLTGATKTPEEFLMLAHYIVDKDNEKESFFQYKRAKAKAD